MGKRNAHQGSSWNSRTTSKINSSKFSRNSQLLREIEHLKRTGQLPLKSDETTNKNENDTKLSFSHRAVSLFASKDKDKKMHEIQSEINKLTDYFKPKVHKLNPMQISANIKMRYKLDKLLSKKRLTPLLYSKSSLAMAKQMKAIEPCRNYSNSRRNVGEELDSRLDSKNQSLDENTGQSSKSGFSTKNLLTKHKNKTAQILLAPVNYLMKLVKGWNKSEKSSKHK